MHTAMLYTYPRLQRVNGIRAEGSKCIQDLQPDQLFVLGIPPLIGPWDRCVVKMFGSQMKEMFLEWVEDNSGSILGRDLGLPEVHTSFICMIADNEFDPRTFDVDGDKWPQLKGMLASLCRYMDLLDA